MLFVDAHLAMYFFFWHLLYPLKTSQINRSSWIDTRIMSSTLVIFVPLSSIIVLFTTPVSSTFFEVEEPILLLDLDHACGTTVHVEVEFVGLALGVVIGSYLHS